jgi:hypothetical protein
LGTTGIGDNLIGRGDGGGASGLPFGLPGGAAGGQCFQTPREDKRTPGKSISPAQSIGLMHLELELEAPRPRLTTPG